MEGGCVNKEEFIGKLQMVYVGDRNAFNEIVEDNQKLKNEVVYSKVEIDRLNKEYERIYNENCKLRENHNINDITLLDENERLNNVINGLEEYIKPYLYMLNGIQDRDIYEQCQLDDFTDIMDKLKELKNGDKE